MKTLFRKSNILHIRTNEGEFEVSNPEIIGDPETIKIIFNDGKPFGGMPIEPVWPGGVELIELPKATVLGQRGHIKTLKGGKLARLLPKEEKKEPFVKALDDIQKIENLSVNNSAHSYTESAYKEFEEAAIKQGHVIESLEPQEKNSVARNAGLKDWDEVYKRILPSQIDPLVNQAIRWSIELYKSQNQSKEMRDSAQDFIKAVDLIRRSYEELSYYDTYDDTDLIDDLRYFINKNDNGKS